MKEEGLDNVKINILYNYIKSKIMKSQGLLKKKSRRRMDQRENRK